MFTTADESKCAHVVKVSGNEEQALQSRLNLAHPCPDDPEWGYGGGGPFQLAVSLMADDPGTGSPRDLAEQRGEDLGDFHKREAEQIRKKVDEEFRIILEQTLGMSPAVCDQLLKPKVDRSQA